MIVEQLTDLAAMLPVLLLVWLTWSFLAQSLGWTDRTEEPTPTPRELYLAALMWLLLFSAQGYVLFDLWRDPEPHWMSVTSLAMGTVVAFLHSALYLAAIRKAGS